MNMGSLKCSKPGDIYILLKSSDFVSHDLYYPFDACQPPPPPPPEVDDAAVLPVVTYQLVLRKWQNLRPERSFRCFLKNRVLVAISQQDCTAYFPQLSVDMNNISNAISEFFTSEGRLKKSSSTDPSPSNVISERFCDPNFVVDLYIDQSLKIWIIDVNAWALTTDSLLFSWNDPPLCDIQSNVDNEGGGFISTAAALPPQCPIVRIVDKETCLRPGAFSEYKAPLEMHQFSQSLTGIDNNNTKAVDKLSQGSAEGLAEFIAFMAQCEKDNNKITHMP
jgi:hypothetical protein